MKNLLNKGLLVKVMCGMLVVTMIGCYSKGVEQQEQQVDQQEQVEVVTPEEPEEQVVPVETEEPEEPEVPEDPVIEDEYITPEEQDVPNTTKEEIAQNIKYTIASNMGSDYAVEVGWPSDNTCNIGIMDNNYVYSGLSTDEIADQCELYGLTDNAAGMALNAETMFGAAGYNIRVNVIFVGADGVAFMMVDSTGYAIYY